MHCCSCMFSSHSTSVDIVFFTLFLLLQRPLYFLHSFSLDRKRFYGYTLPFVYCFLNYTACENVEKDALKSIETIFSHAVSHIQYLSLQMTKPLRAVETLAMLCSFPLFLSTSVSLSRTGLLVHHTLLSS